VPLAVAAFFVYRSRHRDEPDDDDFDLL